jgi:hypothetical protein
LDTWRRARSVESKKKTLSVTVLRSGKNVGTW